MSTTTSIEAMVEQYQHQARENETRISQLRQETERAVAYGNQLIGAIAALRELQKTQTASDVPDSAAPVVAPAGAIN